MRNFAPKSVLQNEREISRLQGDFDGQPGFEGGPWPDKPETSVQRNSLWKIRNWINKGRYLIGRGGSQLWVDQQVPAGIPHTWYWHKTQETVILHVGTSIYTSDYTMATWTHICPIVDSLVTLGDKDSYMDEYGANVFIFCDGAVWKLDLSATEQVYYQINTPVVTVKVTDVPETPTNTIGRRYCNQAARLTGNQHDTLAQDDTTRLTSGISVESESGGTLNVDGDFGEVYTLNPVDATNPSNIGVLQTPTGHGRWTHHRVNSTLDIGSANGFDGEGVVNNSELYIWNNDVPVAKGFSGTMTAGVLSTYSGGIGKFSIRDVGCTLTGFFNGVVVPISMTITGFNNSTNVATDWVGADGAMTLVLGNGRWYRGSQTGTAINIAEGASFDTRDEGRMAYWADGGYSVIRTIDAIGRKDATSCCSANHATQAFTLGHPGSGVFTRRYNDTVPDDILRARVNTIYTMKTRFWEPLAAADFGTIDFGFMFTASEGGDQVYYSQIPRFFEESVGYHDPSLQVEKVKGKIYSLRSLPNIIDVKCDRQTDALLMNTIGQEKNEKTGEVISTIGGHNIHDYRIGTRAPKSIVDIGNGKQMMITSEPGVREYDGHSYGPNVASERIIKILQKMKPERIVGSYDEVNGYMFWEHHAYPADTITETGTAPDTITETGTAPDTITEGES